MEYTVNVLVALCTLTKGWMRVNLTSVFHRSSVTRLSHDGVEEIRTVEINVVGLFQMRQKPRLGSPEKVSQRLRVKVTTLLNTHFSARTFTNSYLNVSRYLPSPGKDGEATGKEYSDSLSFAAAGFPK